MPYIIYEDFGNLQLDLFFDGREANIRTVSSNQYAEGIQCFGVIGYDRSA